VLLGKISHELLKNFLPQKTYQAYKIYLPSSGFYVNVIYHYLLRVYTVTKTELFGNQN